PVVDLVQLLGDLHVEAEAGGHGGRGGAGPLERAAVEGVDRARSEAFNQGFRLEQALCAQPDAARATDDGMAEKIVTGVPDQDEGGHADARLVAGSAVLAPLAALGGVPADDLVEHALLVVEQREVALVELLEELVPGDLDQALVLRLLRVREHDADDTDVVALVSPVDRRRLAALALGPLADGLVVRGGLGHDPLQGSNLLSGTTDPPLNGSGTRAERPLAPYRDGTRIAALPLL